MADKTNMGAVLQFARDIDQKHDQAHGRLRHDIDHFEAEYANLRTKVADLEVKMMEHTGSLKKIDETPIDVGKIVFNPRMVLAVVGLVISIITGNWLTSWPVRESLVRIQEQFTDNIKLQDERSKSVNEKIDNINRQMEMRRLEIQQVSNDLQQIRRSSK